MGRELEVKEVLRAPWALLGMGEGAMSPGPPFLVGPLGRRSGVGVVSWPGPGLPPWRRPFNRLEPHLSSPGLHPPPCCPARHLFLGFYSGSFSLSFSQLCI